MGITGKRVRRKRRRGGPPIGILPREGHGLGGGGFLGCGEWGGGEPRKTLPRSPTIPKETAKHAHKAPINDALLLSKTCSRRGSIFELIGSLVRRNRVGEAPVDWRGK